MKEMFISSSGYMSHIINSLKNMKNLQEIKTIVKTVDKKMLQVLFKENGRDNRKYIVFYNLWCV